MNAAYRRSDAILRLENYAAVIIEHLALVSWFPRHGAAKHWQYELNAFLTGLRRYNIGKGKGSNFTEALIVKTLSEFMLYDTDQESILVGIESHGLKVPEGPEWKLLDKAIVAFAKQVMAKRVKVKK
jgi:hypothetical protein